MPRRRLPVTAPPDAASTAHGSRALPQRPPLEGVDEATWMDVIHRMDEVYSQLVHDEIVLEEKNAQLERSQQFIVSLLSSMSDVLFACNRRGEIEETNTALQNLVGGEDRELRGKSIYTLLADEASRAWVRHLLDHGEPCTGCEAAELNLTSALHGAVSVDVNCTARLDARGRLAGHVFVGRPLGELKRAYRELRDMHDALKRTQQQLLQAEKMASLGRLVAGVAHELNNPISFVLGNVHALKRYSERLAAYLDAVHRGQSNATLESLRQSLRIERIVADLPGLIEGTLEGAQRTADIVNGLKRFSAVDREEHTRVDLAQVVARAIHWVSKGTAPGFSVHWEATEPLPVRGSPGRLLQVLMNLIQNAYDATTFAQVRDPQLRISARRDGERVHLILHDNGPGIAAENLAYIFDPFFTTKPVGKGTGLGLSISYGIIEQHGGRLLARNSVHGGAEFIIDLPLDSSEPAVPQGRHRA